MVVEENRVIRAVGLNNGEIALVDEADYLEVSKYRWIVHKTKSQLATYAQGFLPRVRAKKYMPKNGPKLDKVRKILMHRLVMGVLDDPGVFVDHIDRNGLNNTRNNLRLASNAENARNAVGKKRPARTSSFKGVYLRKGAWRADIKVNRRTIPLGAFETELAAARAYNAAALKYFGEFARLNIFV